MTALSLIYMFVKYCLTSGLRQRLYKLNVSLVTIKQGFVDTPMTADFKKWLLWAKPS